jgi:ABC-type oligopeptide transport system substrate-binding subunit
MCKKYKFKMNLLAALILTVAGMINPHQTLAERPKTEGKFRCSFAANTTHLDPQRIGRQPGHLYLMQMYQGLTMLSRKDMKPIPLLAESIKKRVQANYYSLKLHRYERPSAPFNNNAEFFMTIASDNERI